jgi:plasmid stabilization system protein ParE
MAAIAEYLEARNPDVARRVGARIGDIINLLLKFPNMGRKGVQPGTREMLVPRLPYIIVYRIESDAEEERLAIIGVYHSAQLRPGQEDPG